MISLWMEKYKHTMEIAKIIFKSYMPKRLEKGMLFLNEDVLYELEKDLPNKDEYISINGAPVEPYIIIEGDPNIASDTYIIATPDEIGWWDEGEHTDELREISFADLKFVIEFCDSLIVIEGDWYDIDDEEAHQSYEKFIPDTYDGKIVIQPYNEEDYEEDNNDEGPEYDGAGFTKDDNFE